METTDAIILKLAPYSETTLLLTLLTEAHGVVRVLAKGARRARQNMQAANEPFAWIEASLKLRSPDSLGSIYGATLREGWPYLRRDVERLAYAGLVIEVLGGLASQSPPDPRFFHEARAFLQALSQAPGPGSLTITMLLRALHEAGYPPQLAEPWTAETLPEVLVYHFDRGVFDQPQPTDSPHAFRLPRFALVPLLGFLDNPPPLDGSLTLNAHAGAIILRLLMRVWEDHLNTQLNSARFMEKMVLRPQR